MIDLTIIWACIIAFAITAYVILDGFDLGIGILFPYISVGSERNRAMNSIAPIWDGNETWLVLGGGGLMAAFPLAYAIILPAIYAPMIAMLLALVLRGVAFEFRWRDPSHRALWDTSFIIGSTVASFTQGIMLGAMLQGIPVSGRSYAGGWWDWLTPFTLLTGAGLCVGYALLGACWLIWKTEGELQNKLFMHAKWLGTGLVVVIGGVSIATPFLDAQYQSRWFAWPRILATAQVPFATLLVTILFFRSLRKRYERAPFVYALGLFGLCLLGLSVSIWPDIVPGRVTIWQAASPHASQLFMLYGVALLVPIILAYTAWAYWVFRGKVGEDGYH